LWEHIDDEAVGMICLWGHFDDEPSKCFVCEGFRRQKAVEVLFVGTTSRRSFVCGDDEPSKFCL
nr:hypothetical protein [Tanacetum cinerariifolium]